MALFKMPKSTCTETLADGRSQCSKLAWKNCNSGRCKFHAERVRKREQDDLHSLGAEAVWPTLVKGDVLKVFGQIKATKKGTQQLPWIWVKILDITEASAKVCPLKARRVEGESDPVTTRYTLYPGDPDLVTDLEFFAHSNGKIVAPIERIQSYFYSLSTTGQKCTGMDLRWTKWDKEYGILYTFSCD